MKPTMIRWRITPPAGGPFYRNANDTTGRPVVRPLQVAHQVVMELVGVGYGSWWMLSARVGGLGASATGTAEGREAPGTTTVW